MSSTPKPLTVAQPPDLKTPYPHVDDIEDWRAKQSIRLLWDRVFEHEARLQGVTATAADLVSAANDHQTQISLADRKADEALSQAQLTGAAKAAAAGLAGTGEGGLAPGEPVSGPGSKAEPIIPMSKDLAVIEGNIKASLYHWGRADYSLWLSYIRGGDPWQGGDSKWYQGWDAYMEYRARPGDDGSADHALLAQPAVYTTPPPSGYPTGGWK